jgi:hypothetical protein
MEERLINIKRGIQLIFALCEKEEYCNIKETLILRRNWNIENPIIPGFKLHWDYLSSQISLT